MDATAVVKDLLTAQGRRDPFPRYARLHELGPACALAPGARYAAVVHGYDAVDQVLRDPTFRVADEEYLDRGGSAWREHPTTCTLEQSMFFANGATHGRMRHLFGQAFTPRRVESLWPEVLRLTEELLDDLAERGAGRRGVDFMDGFALPLPSGVIGELLGVPPADRSWFPPVVRAFGAALDLGRYDPDEYAAADKAAVELTAYFTDLLARRRREPQEDLISALAQAQAEDPEQIDDEEMVANLITLFNAGFVTTTHLLGNGLTLLLDRPDELRMLRTDPELAPAYVEEILRYEPPVHFGIRWAAEDAEVAGVPIAAGRPVLLLMAAANRDPNRFEQPDRFDPHRPDNHHLTFSSGPHYCLGAALSRMEGQVALPMLLRRFPRLALAAPPPDREQLVLRGYDHLLVTVD